jgi:predicted nucleotidyltransferase
LNNTRHDILKILAYFDYFNYPLTSKDIRCFLCRQQSQVYIDGILTGLVRDKIVFNLHEFYSLQNKPSLADNRRKGNLMAAEQLAIARKAANLLSRFPFVETVAVSGSLSKQYADEETDIDFFIITTANRLWIARTMMHLFKKLTYLRGRQHWFCMNYYVDEAGMEIPEKNIFTAMEIITLLPMQGLRHFKKFREANKWTDDFFPAHSLSLDGCMELKKTFIRKSFEKIFNSKFGDFVDKWLMTVTDKRWKKKTERGNLNSHSVKIGMSVNRHFSKPDPKNFQAKVVQQYENRVKHLIEMIQPVDVSL